MPYAKYAKVCPTGVDRTNLQDFLEGARARSSPLKPFKTMSKVEKVLQMVLEVLQVSYTTQKSPAVTTDTLDCGLAP